MFKLMGRKIIIILHYKFLLNWPNVVLRRILVMSAETTPDKDSIDTKYGKVFMFQMFVCLILYIPSTIFQL